MSQDPLYYFPLERWSEIQSLYKEIGYKGMSGHAVLETQRKLEKHGFGYGFKVYCPYGDIKNGMVAINEKEGFYEIIILCPWEDTTNLREALKGTKIINWDRKIIIPFVPYHVINCVRMALEDLVDIRILPSEMFILDKHVYEDVTLPPNVCFGVLSSEHVDLVNSTWPHRYATSATYFQMLIETKSGYGLFHHNTLVTWVFFSESGSLLHLFTVEGERKKGLAELLLKLVNNMLAAENKPLLVYCFKDNIKACNLYSKLGFVKVDPIAWCYLTKKVK